jgi:uncharacterized alpha-E superfamily protein
MLARIAHALFWLGRDLTRAEHTARMLDGAFHADVAGTAGDRGISLSWDAVLAIIGAGQPLGGDDAPERAVAIDHAPVARAEAARLLTSDSSSQASIVSCVDRARDRGHTLRDVISTEMWEALNSFYLALGRYDLASALQTAPYSLYREVRECCALFWGLVDRTMLHDEGCAFLEAGGRMEEADMVLRMLRVTVPEQSAPDGHQTEAVALLQAVGGAQAYRRAVREAPTVIPVVHFLLYDSSYPGSVAFSVQALRDALTAADAQPRSAPPVLRLGRLLAELELQRRTPEASVDLRMILERLQGELAVVDNDIGDRYFAVAAFAAVHH